MTLASYAALVAVLLVVVSAASYWAGWSAGVRWSADRYGRWGKRLCASIDHNTVTVARYLERREDVIDGLPVDETPDDEAFWRDPEDWWKK